MTTRKAMTEKVLLLGVDGLDPRLSCKYIKEGIMPNLKQYVERGAQREDLVLLGGHPTVTPPMWTTLATGCYANVHGITGFFRKGSDLDELAYNIDSRLCKAEQLWNVTAEAGKKTLVWHWPGSAWPPSSDSENLLVIDGSTPGQATSSVCAVDTEFIVGANETFTDIKFMPKAPIEASAACVIEDVEEEDELEASFGNFGSKGSHKALIWKKEQLTAAASEGFIDRVSSPIKPASGWENAPEDAKEFVMLFSGGLIRRPALVLKNDEGIYDRIAIYKKKKDAEPLVEIKLGELVVNVYDEAIKNDRTYKVVRNIKLLRLDPEGKSLSVHVSKAMDIENDSLYSPKRLHKEIYENVGAAPGYSMIGRQDDLLISECMIPNWTAVCDWTADAMLYLIEKEDLEVVFSHNHNIDIQEHMFIKHMADKPENRNPVEMADKWMREVYMQTDRYLGRFLHLLDEDWTIIIFSDHAQVAPKNDVPLLCDANGVVTTIMEELGFTKTRETENGGREIVWEETKAVMQREGHIYLNLKGRNQHVLADGTVIDGIVDPADKYVLEEEIMTALYGYKDPKTGHRVCSVALRNKDAVLLGQGGPEAGDICCWHAEGYNFDHADSLSTTYGELDTSVSPIFVAAGKGLKKGYTTDRVIRQIDFAATVAALLGVRMPAQCEGAPVYQIFEEEF